MGSAEIEERQIIIYNSDTLIVLPKKTGDMSLYSVFEQKKEFFYLQFLCRPCEICRDGTGETRKILKDS